MLCVCIENVAEQHNGEAERHSIWRERKLPQLISDVVHGVNVYYNVENVQNSTKERLNGNESKGKEKILNYFWMLEYQHLHRKHCCSHKPTHNTLLVQHTIAPTQPDREFTQSIPTVFNKSLKTKSMSTACYCKQRHSEWFKGISVVKCVFRCNDSVTRALRTCITFRWI